MTKSLLLIVCASFLACSASKSRSQLSVTGSYGFAPNPTDSIAGCWLEALQLSDSLRFQLECNRGAPSYASGFAEGIIPIAHDSAVWRTADFGPPCEIRMAFNATGASVTHGGDEAECGFGNGVRANGGYIRRDTLRPAFDLK